MAMRVCLSLQRVHQLDNSGLRFAIFCGGVTPDENEKGVSCIDSNLLFTSSYIQCYQPDFTPLQLPTLHIMGTTDFVLSRSIALRDQWCTPTNTETLTFEGGHHIPPLRCGLYPPITQWISTHTEAVSNSYQEGPIANTSDSDITSPTIA